MTKSMTAFARVEAKTEFATIAWEVRSVNHRYLDGSFKMPDSYRSVEPALRNHLRKALNRGKVDCMLRIDLEASVGGYQINTEALSQLNQALTQLRGEMPEVSEPNLLEVMKWPGIVNEADMDRDALESAISSAYQDAISGLVEMRKREGEELSRILLEKLVELEAIVKVVRQEAPKLIQRQKEKLEEKLAELETDADPARLEQELVFLAQKSDIMEEIDRLDTHVQEVRSALKQKGPVGRRLDFLMQELNREANTLSSKAVAANTSIQAVELKVLIEQMREQVQNIE